MTQAQNQRSVDLSKAFAQWVDQATLVWNAPLAGPCRCALEYVPGASAADIITGQGSAIPLSTVARGLPERLRGQYPHLAAHHCFDVAADSDQLRDALTSPLIATQRDDWHNLLAATGVQIAGVLDDLFGAAAAEQLGPTWKDATPRLAVWAPTARLVTLK